MATYNGEEYILDQLKSILPQLDSCDEIIVSDDSSTDRTIELIKGLNDNRINILAGNKFRNPIYNFENAIKYSKGDYIFLSDQDDIWIENKVSSCKLELEKFDLVLSDCKIVDGKLNLLSSSFFNTNGSRPGILKNIFSNSYMGCCIAFRRKILQKAIPFPKGIPMHDIWLGLIGELFYSVVFLNEPLILYRRHNNNLSFSGAKSKYSFYTKVKFRFKIIFALSIRFFK
jgi:glycosyltransferase involved in cell wall biosynthesis